jgi:hypothetical protein
MASALGKTPSLKQLDIILGMNVKEVLFLSQPSSLQSFSLLFPYASDLPTDLASGLCQQSHLRSLAIRAPFGLADAKPVLKVLSKLKSLKTLTLNVSLRDSCLSDVLPETRLEKLELHSPGKLSFPSSLYAAVSSLANTLFMLHISYYSDLSFSSLSAVLPELQALRILLLNPVRSALDSKTTPSFMSALSKVPIAQLTLQNVVLSSDVLTVIATGLPAVKTLQVLDLRAQNINVSEDEFFDHQKNPWMLLFSNLSLCSSLNHLTVMSAPEQPLSAILPTMLPKTHLSFLHIFEEASSTLLSASARSDWCCLVDHYG